MTDPDDEARLIAESAADFARGHGGPEKARRFERDGKLDRECWHGMAELGWFGIAVPEAAGGLGLGPTVACLVSEAAGRELLTPPLQAAVASATLLAASNASSARDCLEALLAGSRHVAFVLGDGTDTGGNGTAGGPLTTRHLADIGIADTVVVASGTGTEFEAHLLTPGSNGVTIEQATCVDGSSLGRLVVERSTWSDAPCVLQGESGESAWQRAVDLHRLLDAASLCGLMSSALDMALDYLRLRRQFGVPIGCFQALQHRAVDCHLQRSAARALLREAALAQDTSRASWAAAAAARVASRAALHVTKENIQFHGAIGFADEHDAGLYLRRAMVLAARQRVV